MLKLATLFLALAGSALAAFCPTQPITSITLGGNLPNGVANITAVPQGTNCTFTFNIPNNYNILFKFSAQSGSDNDKVTIYDNNNYPLYTLKMSSTPVYDVLLWLPARSAAVRVEAASGNMKFMLSYQYQSLSNYQRMNKKTGEYFPLTQLTPNTYVTITSSSVNEKVIVSPASRAGSDPDASLTEMYVYDGDNINTANVMGRLSDFTDFRISTGQSVSIVNLAGRSSRSYVLGNDASTLNGFGKYTVLLTSKGTSMRGSMTDLTGSVNGAAYTWICTDCSTFYWTKLGFDSFSTISNKAYVSFQGQTPTHKREKLIRYDTGVSISSSKNFINVTSHRFGTVWDVLGGPEPERQLRIGSFGNDRIADHPAGSVLMAMVVKTHPTDDNKFNLDGYLTFWDDVRKDPVHISKWNGV
ncbi:hypothetical protein B9Z55_016340 [Caenorhabditis nigoni]|uniref:CUB-like domain-containing protein n=1 Tax=Caenorhabditis nigoni TaxID=1611254 RepID=A0A2G5T4S9_9PELO|nr:hypothetical protein B9Z55_016340 [Caenorhabditis nigoni]